MLDPQKEKLIAQAKAELEKLMWGAPAVDSEPPMTEADSMAHLLQDAGRRHRAPWPWRVRVSPTIAADYQARNVFPNLRPSNGEPLGRYFIDHDVSRAVAQAVYDDAVEQAARGGSLERRSLTLAYNALAGRTCRTANNVGDEWSRHNPDDSGLEPADFREQAPIVDALLRSVSRISNEKPRQSKKRGN